MIMDGRSGQEEASAEGDRRQAARDTLGAAAKSGKALQNLFIGRLRDKSLKKHLVTSLGQGCAINPP
jgi:hypothetical protein